jgi:hypothetical protein
VLFRQVLPHSISSMVSKHCDETVMQHTLALSASDAATNEARATLNAVGLPESIESAKSNELIPQNLWGKIERVQTSGGYDRLMSMLADVQSASLRVLTTLQGVDDAIEKEMRADDSFRARFAGSVTSGADAQTRGSGFGTTTTGGVMPQPTALLCGDIHNNCNALRSTHATAKINNDSISEALIASSIQLRQLSLSKDQLQALFPKNTYNLIEFEEIDTVSDGSQNVVDRLEMKLHMLAALFEDRSKQVCSLMLESNKDIRPLVVDILSSTGDVAQFLRERSVICEAMHASVTASIAQQNALLADILNLNEQFLQSRAASSFEIEKNRILTSLTDGVTKYLDFQSKLSGGMTFYSSFQVSYSS